ncbi:MAG: phospho-N-acetylmuramoyl-pentapeptide-transferase [Candidatus Dojkabacteria bacterium]|nr:MAG: phospho-N-acetylmuramoyl-pentapeptide-transferase [Candidatus Dojkabacteria bacterium]
MEWPAFTNDVRTTIYYILVSFVVSMLLAPILIKVLYKYNVVRKTDKDFASIVGDRFLKAGTPIMGGTLVVFTTTILTILFNWNGNTYIPIAVLLISALLGGMDDLLNIFGRKRVVRTIKKQVLLARVHKSPLHRLYLWLTLPWIAYKNIWYALGSYPGSGIHAGEKIIVQLMAGAFVAWWIYSKLGWDTVWFPWIGTVELGYLMPIFIIFTVVSMTNAVNISDGMDGLSSGLLIFSFIAYLIISLIQGNFEIATLIAVAVGSLIAYLYFNIKPARFEMGDVGTLALGAMLATVAFALDRPILLPVIGFMFVAEIGSSLIQGVYRRIFGKRLWKMAPLHLHYQIKGWSEEKVVMRFWLMAGLFALVGVWLSLM